jgi:hypothetical protein
MSNTIIQIKRSTTTALPANLQPGELAYTSNGEVLFIGSVLGPDTANVVAIGGKRVPGVLTSNQAIVTNSNNFIDSIKVNQLVIGPDGSSNFINAISTDSTISGSNNNGYVLLTANAVKTYVDASGFYGIRTSNGTSSNLLSSNSSAQDTLTIQGTNNQVAVSLSGDTFTISLPDNIIVANNLSISTVSVTNTTTSSNTTTGALTVAGGIGVAGKIYTSELAIGNTTTFTSVNGTVISTNDVYATGTVNASTLSVGNSVVANTSGVFTSGVVNAEVVQVGSQFKANTTQITIASNVAISANGTTGTNGQILVTTGAGVYWKNISSISVSSVTAGEGLIGGGTGGDLTIDVGAGAGIAVNSSSVSVKANNGIVANSSGVFVNPGTGVTVNTTGVHIGQDVGTTSSVTFDSIDATGNVTLGSNSSDIVSINARIHSHIIPSANSTYNLGSEDSRWLTVYANNIHAGHATFDHGVNISGNLNVTGTLVTINVETLSVSDSLIQLASNNNVSDLLDIGFYGSYNNSNSVAFTGVFRDSTDGRFKLFDSYLPVPSTTIDSGDPSFNISTLMAYLLSGGLSTNSTAVNITANSTVSVAIVANTLSLSTPLSGNSGGTGLNSFTPEDIIVANSSNGFRKLSLGVVGTILQSNGAALVYAGLDGGTF